MVADRKNKVAGQASRFTPIWPADQAIRMLQIQREKGQQILTNRPITSAVEQTWETVTEDVLSKAFGADSPNVGSVMNVGRWDFAFGGGNEQEWEQKRAENMQTRLGIIHGLIEMLEAESASGTGVSTIPHEAKAARTVFLVHGHSEATTQTVARFLERLDLTTIILREQPNAGRTIIEKFEDFSNVGFAIVLLTGDDRGGLATQSLAEMRLRARQNVILELGFFLAKLGRRRVCALYQHDVEIPSDYSGVLFVPIDEGGAWRFALAKEVKAAGLEVDLNKAV